MNLVIVESPAKGRTIKNILGANFNILASFGHVRDLPEKTLGVDVKENFKPEYVIPAKARKTIKLLKDEIKKVDKVYLATDFDREGEAIAWHIVKAIGLEKLKTKNATASGKAFKLKTYRITFHEITKPAILEALKHPRDIDINLVDSQQARRILDRLVGYKLSPFLWQKVARGLSAGRVQSVAVRLIVEREREIKNFRPEEYWQIVAHLRKKSQKETFNAILIEAQGQKITKLSIKNQKQAQDILGKLFEAKYIVADLETREKKRYPSPPFTTSTLQQEAGRNLRFSAKKTMKIAQDLYEDGLITYMRTDSVQVSALALAAVRKVILEQFGQNYALEKPRIYKTKTRGAQEAHEAIRPTNLGLQTINQDTDQNKLYTLIWKKMIASQTKEAVFDETVAKIKAHNFIFQTTGAKLKFDGFLKIYGKIHEEDASVGPEQLLPKLEVKEELDLKELEKEQYFTQPPPRYSEGTLIKELEKRGIGRPSTYVPTLSTIVDRGYIDKIEGKLVSKEVGEIVSDLLVKHFPEIVDYGFTAKMEEEFDEIAEGKLAWQKVLAEFYEPFSNHLKEKFNEVSKKEIAETKTQEKCPKCGKNLIIKLGRYGKFLACSGFPKCKFTKPYLEIPEKKAAEKTQEKCPKCGKKLALKEGKYGPFLACEGYPGCKFTKNIEVTAKVACPNCQGKLVQKRTRKGKVFWGCSGYPSCKTAFWDEPIDKKCSKCSNIMVKTKDKREKCSVCREDKS